MRAGPQLRVFYPSWRKRQPYGSAMGLQAAPLRSPFKVVADASILPTNYCTSSNFLQLFPLIT